MSGHLIDMQELRQREINELERRMRERRDKCERQQMEMDSLGRRINDLTCFAVTMINQSMWVAWCMALNPNLGKPEKTQKEPAPQDPIKES